MRLILEKDEIVRILGKHFDAQLDPAKVVIRTEPVFEIELCGIPLSDLPEGTSTATRTAVQTDTPPLPGIERYAAPVVESPPTPPRDDDDASAEPPPPGIDGVDSSDPGSIHPAAILAKSKELAEAIDRENPQLATRSRRGTLSKLPTNFSNET